MHRRNASALSLITLALTALLPSLALAAGGGGGHGHHPEIVNWWGALSEKNADAPALGWMMVTFAIFCAIVYFAVRRPLATYVANRSDEVKRAIEEAKLAREEAEAKAREYEERLANLDKEIEALKQDFRSRGEAEVRRLEEAGQHAAQRIAKDAEDTISAEFDRARHALKQEAARLALELAEETVRGVIKTDDHQRLEKAFLVDVSRPN